MPQILQKRTCTPSIHPNTLTDISRTESGFHLYAIAKIMSLKEGESRVFSLYPASREAALTFLDEIKANPISALFRRSRFTNV
ncbi:hypothetical protein [Enterobacter cloacae]|uniref:hypothetical protein n=1 Tax=Enterobacter cloacae TaxID=550 RepID=UPI002FFA225F